MVALAAVAVLALLLLSPLAFWAYNAISVREGPYVNANRALLAGVSPVPGSRQLRIDSSPILRGRRGALRPQARLHDQRRIHGATIHEPDRGGPSLRPVAPGLESNSGMDSMLAARLGQTVPEHPARRLDEGRGLIEPELGRLRHSGE